MRVRSCCGFCCPHIEGTCPNYSSKPHETCIQEHQQARALGLDHAYPPDYFESVDGEAPHY